MLRHLLIPLLILASVAWPVGAVAAKNVAVIMSTDADAYREASESSTIGATSWRRSSSCTA